MHFEILVEGQSELTALSILMRKIIGEYNDPHTWKIHKHRGIGQIPDNPAEQPNKNDQTLLHNLAAKLRAYSKEDDSDLIVVVLVDLDDRENCIAFKNELVALLDFCDKKPRVLFRIAIEELEAWYLGDFAALKLAYPDMKQDIFDTYVQDSQISTWETFAEMVHPSGLNALITKGKRSNFVLEEKVNWAKNICPHLNVEQNQSPSFCCFRNGLRRIIISPNGAN
jgi:hypothetical protein